MIIDTFTDAIRNPLYPKVICQTLQEIKNKKPHGLAPGKYIVQGDDIFFSVIEGETRPLNEQQPEFHRQYIDIHIVLSGKEIIGAGVKGLPLELSDPFNEEHDLGFCQKIASETLIHLQEEELAIIFPYELHRPMCTHEQTSSLRKIVVKINQALLQP
ncbi:hypothetical protein DT73_08045 [Mangrovibacter sp. MFB070]|uniref:YhcH/YjgK/YiaL family protein n=1 Tax=Mangrovibacter sp. MFB070 TaxID=1224318 RepID=UPI0004D4784A|nr:YhcH/YjgK/YiaL family protein [Mangrovibacter sp. MFB070]KEA53302.1 hypothetical protein DT73_08045 [Mangrovibacter sp. MFB070]